ncbi:MAG: PAS domain-containing sensor histidine kinase [Deltaproteobacteria bacterium]|nr:PAS domain-containing sensor histidine kinase [Deltaproteobacteria bacterium]
MGNSGKDTDMASGNDKDIQDLIFYRFIIDSLPVAVLTVNADLKITGFNPWAEKVTGYSAKEAVGQYCGKILQGGMCHANCPLRTVLNGHKPLSLVETKIVNKWGVTIPVRMNTAGLFDDNDHLIGGVESFQDISRLKSLEREKDNIISMFAHDMKSCLATIGGFTVRLLKKASELDEEKRTSYLGIIRKETEKLDVLVYDFLEFSRLQTGELKLNFQAFSLDKELIELFEVYQSREIQSGISLIQQNGDILPVIKADPVRLRRVFTNLLDNAFKFSKKGDRITISSEETAQEIKITIKDQGVGIDPKDLPFIFDIFYRGTEGTGETEGSGVGLAVVKTIVESHGGRILVQSEPGRGAAFTVVLPKLDRRKRDG